jgi:hypothetical protein
MWEHEALTAIRAALENDILYNGKRRPLSPPMLRDVVKAHKIANPSRMYYRPQKSGSRAQYGQALVDWIIDEYTKDSEFFTKAHQAAAAADAYA